MCDNLGIDDTKVMVYKLSDGNYSNVVFENYDAILEWIEADLESSTHSEGDTFSYDIKIGFMTRAQIEALPEAE